MRPVVAITAASLLIGGLALLAFGHQRLTLSAEGFENAWVVMRPIRRRSIPMADIKSIDVITNDSGDSSIIYLSIRTTKREMRWTVYTDYGDMKLLRSKVRKQFKELKRLQKVSGKA